MFRWPSIGSIILVLVAFVVLAMHIGLGDHSSHLMTSGPMSEGSLLRTPSVPDHGAGAGNPMEIVESISFPAPQQTGMTMTTTMTMFCQLLALLTIVGVAMFWVVSARASVGGQRVLQRSPSLRRRRGVVHSRPPGLTVLCVARC